MAWLLLGVCASTILYASVVPRILEPYRNEQWSWNAFSTVHVLAFIGLPGAAILRGSLIQRVVAFLGVLTVWLYAFFFVWFNVWGT